MTKAYLFLRVAGYVASLLGVVLFTLGRQGGDPKSPLMLWGLALLAAGFLSFFVTYVLWMLNRLMGRRR
ncbi:MAG: hypothetical protein V1873_02395 [Verrucomicrobiota bacterium]